MNVSEWIQQYQKLDGRFPTMLKALELFNERSGTTIVETGCIRFPDDWGAGMSTYIFGSYAKKTGASVYTVDISQDNMNCCKEVTKEFADVITYTVQDSLAFLSEFSQTINLLYLDSMDCPIEAEPDDPELVRSQTHQLTEAQIALPKISPDGIILLDDNGFPHGGKTKLTKIFLAEEGWKELLYGQQSLWIQA